MDGKGAAEGCGGVGGGVRIGRLAVFNDRLGWRIDPLLLSHETIDLSIDTGPQCGVELLSRHQSLQLLPRAAGGEAQQPAGARWGQRFPGLIA